MTTGTIKGAEVGFSHAGHVHFTSSMEYFQLCEHDSEKEEESAESKKVYSPGSPSPLLDTDECCLTPPPMSAPARQLGVSLNSGSEREEE